TYVAEVLHFDWSPDATKLVVAAFDWGHNDLYVVHLPTSTVTLLGTVGYRVRWSPDGSKIAFLRGPYGNLLTINPDGSDEQVLVEYSYKGNTIKSVEDEMGWSPDGNYLHYTWRVVRMGNERDVFKYSVHRIEVDGDNPTSMTGDLPDDTYPMAHAWR
ncbi:MAG: PD40 domain-containing protein, partial [Thermoplasmata archaeon]